MIFGNIFGSTKQRPPETGRPWPQSGVPNSKNTKNTRNIRKTPPMRRVAGPQHHYGFVVWYFDYDAGMMDATRIIAPICESLDEVIDAILRFIQHYLSEIKEPPLSARAWKSLVARIESMAGYTDWDVELDCLPELMAFIAPCSIKVSYIAMSPRLVRCIKNE